MVGVPGRSKGCSTCRSRKKGCGKQLPSCIQCVQAGLICGGYERTRIWINDTSKENWTGPATYTPDKKASTPPTSNRPGLDDSTSIILSYGFTQTARQELYLGHYWDTYQPVGNGYSSSDTTSFSTTGWAGVPQGLYDQEPALKYALYALSASTLSVQANDQDLRVKGLQAYVSAIQELSVAFKQPQRIRGDGLLGAIRLMSFFEIVFGAIPDTADRPGWSSQINGWHGHICGEKSILRIRGPESFVSGAAHELFRDGRLQILSLAISKRQRTLLSEPAWKTIPWQNSEKTAKDLVLDILADVPGLLEDLDLLRACKDLEQAKEAYLKLKADCDRAHADLELWKTAFGADVARYDYTVTTGSLPLPGGAGDLRLLRLGHIYWMTCMLVYSTNRFASEAWACIHSTLSAGDDASCHSDSKNTPGMFVPSETYPADSHDAKIYAYKIAHAVHLFTKPAYRLASFHAAMIPLAAALRILVLLEPPQDPSEERKMLVDYFKQPYMGSYAGKFMRNLQLFLTHQDMAGRQYKEV